MRSLIKLPNGQEIVDWQYLEYRAWKSQVDEYERKSKERKVEDKRELLPDQHR